MASSYSADLKLELMVTGEKSDLWGDITNTNLTILQQAIAGYEAISIAGGAQTTALTFSNGLVSNGKNAVIKLTGTITGNQVVTIPDSIEKTYTIENGTTGAFTVEFKTVSGTGPTFAATDKGIKFLYSNGTDVVDVYANQSPPIVIPDPIPSGTKMLFVQTAAPTGFTKDTSNNNKALRVVSGTASSGGSVGFTTAFASQAVSGTVGTTGATTLTEAQIPSHTHVLGVKTVDSTSIIPPASLRLADFNGSIGASPPRSSDATGGGGSHTHSGGTFTGTAIDLAVQYVDVIIATKD
jgi:hypothetical protein